MLPIVASAIIRFDIIRFDIIRFDILPVMQVSLPWSACHGQPAMVRRRQRVRASALTFAGIGYAG